MNAYPSFVFCSVELIMLEIYGILARSLDFINLSPDILKLSTLIGGYIHLARYSPRILTSRDHLTCWSVFCAFIFLPALSSFHYGNWIERFPLRCGKRSLLSRVIKVLAFRILRSYLKYHFYFNTNVHIRFLKSSLSRSISICLFNRTCLIGC